VADPADVRRIALGLPQVVEERAELRFAIRGKPICWPWLERVEPGGARRPRADVIAVRTAGEAGKQDLLALGPPFFTEGHYEGYPAVLVRLPEIDVELLREILTAAWRVQAPRSLVKASTRADAGQPMDRG